MGTKKSMKKILRIMLMLIGFSGFLWLPAVAAAKWPLPDGIKAIEVNGYDMAYQEVGSGVPLLLVHGTMADYRVWSRQGPDFSKAYRTIIVSLRHSYPEKWNGVGDDFSVAQHASDVAALINKLNLGKVHLVGHSRGGAVALTVARVYPDVIRTLILEDAGGMESLLPDTPESQRLAANVRAFADSIRAILEAGDFEKAARVFLDTVNGPGAWEKASAEGRQMMLDNIGTFPQSFERPKIGCAEVQKFNFPVLLLTGERSPRNYGQMITAFRKCKDDIPAPLVIPNGTHNMQRDNPEFFNKAVLDFLNQH